MNRKFHVLTRLNGATGKPYANGKADAPPTPDYVAAANATAAGNLATAKYTTAANRVNQVTPYGNLNYTQGPTTVDQAGYDAALANYNSLSARQKKSTLMPTTQDFTTPSWTATQTLTPAQQAILEKNQGLSSGLLDTAQQGLNYAQDVMAHPGVDTSKLPSYGINPGEAYSDAIMRRLQPQMQEQQQSFDAKMANSGVMPGTAAYDAAYRNFAQGQNDQRTSAITGGMNVGLNANQQGFQQEAYNQMQPINVINALRTGSQVQGPNYVNSAQMPSVAGPDVLGATQAGYNAELAGVNAQNAASGGFMSGLMGLGGAALGNPALFKGSDQSIKENISKIGSLDNGINIYKFEYRPEYKDTWGHGSHIGVMAQDVEKVIPEAVATHKDGYKVVNYAMLGA